MNLRFLFVAMAVLSLVPTGLHAQDQDANELPRSWNIKQIEKDAPNWGVPGKFYVLSWHASAWTYMGKKHRRENVLALRVFGDKPNRWDLYHLYREPLEKDPSWHPSMHHATGGEAGPTGRWYFHCKVFNAKPGNKEIYESLPRSSTGVNWRFVRGVDCVGCGVCEKSWREAIGEKPIRFFPKVDKKESRK